MSINRDELNKALGILRKKDPQNATLQKFDEYLRSFSGNSDKTSYGSINLWDNWNKNVSSATQENRLMNGPGKKMVQNLDGSWQSAGYQKAIDQQKAAHDAVVQGLADPSTDPVNMDIYNAAQKKLKADQEAMAKKKQQQTGQKTEPKLSAFDSFNKKYILGPQEWLYKHTLGPASDFIDRMAASGVNELTVGNAKKHIMNDPKAQQIFSPTERSWFADPTTKSQKVADVLGSLYASAPAFMGIGKVVDPLAGLMTANKYGQAAIRGGLAMGTYSGAKNIANELINPSDANLKQRLTDVGLNTAFGAVLDPAMVALGPIAQRVLGKLANGKSVSQVAKEEGVPEKSIADLYDYSNRQFQTQSSGQIIDPNAPQLNAPQDPITRLLGGATNDAKQLGNSPLGLNEPIYNRTFNTGKDVQVNGVPQLEAPKFTGHDIQTPEQFHQLEQDIQHVYDQRKAYEDQHVQEAMQPFLDTAKKQAEAEQTWQTTVKQAKDTAQRIKEQYGKIFVPKIKSGSVDSLDNIPAQFRSAKGASNTKAPYDIYKFAQDEGFHSPEEAVRFLQQLDADSKLKLQDLMPKEGSLKLTDEHLKALEDNARRDFANTPGGKSMDNLFQNLMKIHSETAPKFKGNDAPLSFKKEKGFIAKKDPLNYTGQMNPKDMSAVRSEGSYSTRQADSPTGDTLKIKNTTPQETPLQFKKTVEQQGMKQTIQKEVPRKSPVEADSRKVQTENVNNSQATPKPETSSNAKPMGIVAGNTAHVNDVSWIQDPKSLLNKIKEGDINLKQNVQSVKTHAVSDLQFVKDVMRQIAESDMGQTLQMMGKNLKDVKFEDNLYKGLRSVRRAISEAINASKGDYGKILKDLKQAKISKRDAEEYFSAVHFRDVLVHNHDKMVRAGEVDQRLQEIEDLIRNTKDKKTLESLGKEEDALLQEKKDLEPYVLPKEATPEKVQAVLDRWKNTPAMINAQREFIAAQRKDLQMRVDSGLLSQAQMDAMVKAHPNYVYMGRAGHDITPANISGNISKVTKDMKARRNGSEDNLSYAPMEAAIRNRILTYHNVRRNDAMSTIEKLAQTDAGKEYFTPLNPHAARPSQMENAVKFYKDGEVQYYEVPPLMKQAFDNLDSRQAKDVASKVLRSVQNVIKRGSTHYNLDFILASPFRETNALITSRTNLHPGELVLGYLDSFLGKNLEKYSGGLFKSYKDVYKEMGGHYTGYVTTEPKDVKDFLKAVNKGNWGKGLEFINPKHIIEHFGQNMDHGPKLAEFRSAKTKGYGNKDAMHQAVDVFDYTDLGTSTRALNNYVPYFGPYMKGITRYLQAAKENPAAFLGKNLTYITAPTLAIYGLRFAPYVTDEQRSKINNMSDFKKNMTWAIPAPNGKDIWLIPKMHVGAQLFANPLERFLDKWTEQNPKTWNQLVKDTGKDGITNLLPPSAVAGVQLISDSLANYNRLLDMPIEDANMVKNPDKTQHFNAYTSELAKKIGSATGQSPAKLDYILKGLTGGAGRDMLDVADNTLASLGVNRPSKTQTTLDILNPVNRYKMDNSASLGTYDRLTNLSKQNDWNRAQVRSATGQKSIPKNDINKIDDAYKELNKTIAGIREDMKMSPSEKKQKITVLRDQQRKLGDMLIKSGKLKNY